MKQHAIQSEKLKALFHSGKLFHYHKNETILRAGETPRGVYLIETGTVKMYSLPKDKNEHVLDFFGPNDLFPITWPFRRSVRSVYYEAISQATAWLIPRETFRDFLNGHPDVMSDVLEAVIERYHLYVGRIDNLLYSDARERIVHRLLSLANRFGVQTKQGVMIDALITHEDLAHSISMTRETFGRTLTRLQQKGMIGYDDQHHIVITDLRRSPVSPDPRKPKPCGRSFCSNEFNSPACKRAYNKNHVYIT